MSVIICTYNPKPAIFSEVLKALENQTLPQQNWRLIVVDNNSEEPVSKNFNLDWHRNAVVIREDNPGLAHARLAGFQKCQPGDLIVFIDDDNVPDAGYLQICRDFSAHHPEAGCFGGKSLPVFETPPPGWFYQTQINLGCQDLGDDIYISNYRKNELPGYPPNAPIGTGMAITYNAFKSYVDDVASSPDRLALGRKGTDLSSGEDNDIVLTIIKKGYEIAYVPSLIVHHLIPQVRYSFGYLKQMAYKSNLTWIRVLELHHINPHKPIAAWTVLPRKLKAWFKLQAWKSKLNYIRWQGACGTFDALALIKTNG